MTDPLKKLDANINISKIPLDTTTEYHLTEEVSWMTELFDELEEDTDRTDDEYVKGFLQIDLSIKRRNEKPFGDHLLIKGEIQANFQLPCIRCLKMTNQTIDEPFTASFLNKNLENEPEYEEADDIFAEGTAFDLYFHEKGKIDVKEMLHEQTYIHVNAFALHDEECKGLCSQCGTNLNTDTCTHQN